MNKLVRSIAFLTALVLCAGHLFAADKTLLELKGEYLIYSYDHNQILGTNVEFLFAGYEVFSRYIKIDVPTSSFCAYGAVVLKKDEQILSGDELVFLPKENKGRLISYGEQLLITPIGVKEGEEPPQKNDLVDVITMTEIRNSFIYCTGQTFQITEGLDVYGINVTFFVEGMESVGFKKLKLSDGLQQRRGGFALDKIWYTRVQGLIFRASYLYEKENKVNSLNRVNYEERSILKNYTGAKRQVDIMSSTTINFNPETNLGITGNYNSSGLWNANFWLNRKWSEKFNTNFDFSYNKPVNYDGEAWFGLQSTLNGGKLGSLVFAGRYELQDQVMGNLSYGTTFFKTMSLLLTSSYSRIKISGSQDFSEILSGGVSLSHNSRLFNLSTDYYLNYDLMGSQLLSQPQLQLGLNPITFYGGLLSVGITNVFIYNRLKKAEDQEYTYSNNTVFNLATRPVYLHERFYLNFNVAVEQFMEKENRNFTSTGFIINASQEFFTGIFLEAHYSVQSRRRSKNWLIEGTTSQDMSILLRINPSQRINSWASFSYDPKNAQWRQAFADISVEFFKSWQFHTIMNYDFLLKKINNVDLFLIRNAGRFQLRFIWRSLSKQFLVELIPR